jgi:ribonuclease J
VANEVKIIPLGGIGEIGKNSTLIEINKDLLLIDAGFKFPSADMPGIDFIIPDYSYLKKKKKYLKGIVLTHGHLDHIGALRYLLEDVKPPVIAGSPITLGLVKGMLPEKIKKGLNFVEIDNRSKVKTGAFDIEFIRVTHSIPGSFGIAIHTPEGVIFHTGDYKIDNTPIDGKKTDIERLKELSKEGIIALLSDSTNADESGFTGSESLIGKNLIPIFNKSRGRIIAATFSTNIHRVQQFVNVAEKFGRKVAFNGRSLVESVKTAKRLGYLKVPQGVEIELSNISTLPKRKIVLITTGTQGEPMSGLVRIANGTHNGISITKGDTVIVSADPIPGNERMVSDTINKLFKLGADVYYRKEDGIHVSGHCSQEDIKLMLKTTKPKYYIPVHGEYRHLVFGKKIAMSEGMSSKNIFILENGLGVRISGRRMKKLPKVKSGSIIIEGSSQISMKGKEGMPIFEERKEMANKGIFFIVVLLGKNGKVKKPVHIETRGMMLSPGNEGEILKLAKKKVVETVEKFATIKGRQGEVEKEVEKSIKKLFRKSSKKTPAIFSLIIKEKSR